MLSILPRRLAAAFWWGLGVLLPVALSHRNAFSSGFEQLSADRYDGLIARAIQHHWFNVVTGRSRWSEVGYFHPAPGTLGYNDGYFLLGLPDALLVALGVEPLLSGELAYMAVRLLGCASMLLLARRLGLALPLAALAALTFGTLNSIVIRGSIHAQLLSVYFLPGLVLLGLALARRWNRVGLLGFTGWAALLGAGVGALLLTSFYTAFFFGLFLILGGLAWLLLGRPWRSWQEIAALRTADWQRRHLPRLAILALALGLGALPTLILYLPTARQTGMHSVHAALSYAVRWPDLLDLGSGNRFWSAPISALRVGLGLPPLGYSEQSTGFTPLLLLVALLSPLAVRSWPWPRRRLLLAVACASLGLLLLTFAVGQVSLWRIVRAVVPGAGAVRVLARAQLFLGPAVIVLAFATLHQVQRRFGLAAALVLAGLIAAEQTNDSRLNLTSRAETSALLQRAAAARMPECRVFFAVNPRPGKDGNPESDAFYTPNVDAMFISALLAWPTLNGFSSFNPPGWEMVHRDAADYRERALRTARRGGVTQGLCAVDIGTGKAEPVAP